MLKDFVLKNRSYRRFYEEKKIETETLSELVDLARNTPSAANRQPLRYILVNDEEKNEICFRNVKWAGYLSDWDGPQAGERPSAYIIMVTKGECNSAQDEGIAGQTILLGAAERGLGGCFIGNVDREHLTAQLGIDKDYKIKLVIALGYPKEEVVIEEIHDGEDIRYYRDDKQIHHVPKLALEDVIIRL